MRRIRLSSASRNPPIRAAMCKGVSSTHYMRYTVHGLSQAAWRWIDQEGGENDVWVWYNNELRKLEELSCLPIP